MAVVEVSGSLIVRDKNLLMVFDEEREVWNIPTSRGKKGELSAETAERVAEECTGCSSEAVKYKKKFKNEYQKDGEVFRLQPFRTEIDGEPEEVEWVKVDELHSKDVAEPLEEIVGKLKDKL